VTGVQVLCGAAGRVHPGARSGIVRNRPATVAHWRVVRVRGGIRGCARALAPDQPGILGPYRQPDGWI